jgi:hypothetical protein
VIEPSLKTGSVDAGKSIGRVKVATPDVVGNVNQIVQRNPHISVRPLSQQAARFELIINPFPPLSKINFHHFSTSSRKIVKKGITFLLMRLGFTFLFSSSLRIIQLGQQIIPTMLLRRHRVQLKLMFLLQHSDFLK